MKMKLTNRRSFLEKLGLGVGAGLLGPVATRLVREAQGAVIPQKRIVFFLTSNGTAPYYYTPSDIDAGSVDTWTTVSTTNYNWPPMVQALQKFRGTMLLIDGLPNRIPLSQHSSGYGALSMMPCALGQPAEYGGPPGGITIDQFIAGKLGTGTPFKSIATGQGNAAVQANVFASGQQAPVPAIMSPRLLFRSLFGAIASTGGSARQRLLLDTIKTDLARLNNALAGPEKDKLAQYTAILEDYDARQQSLTGLSCTAPTVADTDPPHLEDRLESVVGMATVALGCGMTSVVGIAAACGNGHQAPAYDRMGVTFSGHDPVEIQGPAQTKIHNFHAGLMATMATTLQGIKEGDKTAFDNTVIVYMNDNGDAHHASHNRYPLVVVGNAGGALKSDGRFIRYPSIGQPGQRSLADFYCSIAHAVGAPTDTFGMGGVETVTGPLPEIMA